MYRLSPTMISAVEYYLSLEDEDRSAQARAELLARMRGEPLPASEAAQKGQAFEDMVFCLCNGDSPGEVDNKLLACGKEVAGIVKGSLWQVHVGREIGGVMLHGYIDCLRGNHIFDIKTTRKYEIGKYLHNTQHLAYLYCLRETEVRHFSYVVSDFRSVYREDYDWYDGMVDLLKAKVAGFFDYLAVDDEMRQAYESRDHEKERNGTDQD